MHCSVLSQKSVKEVGDYHYCHDCHAGESGHLVAARFQTCP